MHCVDSSVGFLNGMGYNIVRYPKDSVKVHMVYYGTKRGMEPLMRLDEMLCEGGRLPPVKRSGPLPTISGLETDRLSASAGLQLADRCLQAMGAPASASADISLDATGGMSLVMENVMNHSIRHADIPTYLDGKPLSELYVNARDLVGSKHLYLIVETITSDSFSIRLSSEADASLSGQLAMLGKRLAGTKVEVSSRADGKLTYKGPRQLTFGFKAMELIERVNTDGSLGLEARMGRQNLIMRGENAGTNLPVEPEWIVSTGRLIDMGDGGATDEPDGDMDTGNPYLVSADGEYRPFNLHEQDFDYVIHPKVEAHFGEKRDWSILIVMGAGSSLASALWENLQEVKAAAHGNAHVCVFFDGPFLTDSFLLYMNEGSTLREDIVLRYLSLDIKRPGVLDTIMEYAWSLFPARHTMLVLSGHGLGFGGILSDTINVHSDAVQRAIRIPAEKNACVDRLMQCSKDATAMVQKAIRDKCDMNRRGPFKSHRYDILAMDACSMGSMETLFKWRGWARRMIVSELPEPDVGYPYQELLEILDQEPDITPDEYAARIAQAAYRYMLRTPLGRSKGVTQMAVDMNGLLGLLQRFDQWLATIAEAVSTPALEQVAGIFDTQVRFEGNVDLRLLAASLARGVEGPIGVASEELLRFIDSSSLTLSVSAPTNRYLPKGLSIYLPRPEDYDMQYSENMRSFADDYFARWCTTLALYYQHHLKDRSHEHPLIRQVFGWISHE